jgi:hypothetical protein
MSINPTLLWSVVIGWSALSLLALAFNFGAHGRKK